MKIRFASISDADTIAWLSEKTFIETYWGTDTDENILWHVATHFNSARIASEILDTKISHYLLVETDEGKAVGYARMRYDQTLNPEELKDKKAIEVARIYVLQEFQGQKIGQLLLEYIEKLAKEAQCEAIWLCVWKENYRGIKFYQRHGIEIIGEYIFKLGTTVYVDWAMAKML